MAMIVSKCSLVLLFKVVAAAVFAQVQFPQAVIPVVAVQLQLPLQQLLQAVVLSLFWQLQLYAQLSVVPTEFWLQVHP